jgi:hypothetical protein
MIKATYIIESLNTLISINERNVVNVEAIDKFVADIQFDEKPEIQKWLGTAFRKYLINDYPGVSTIKGDMLHSYSNRSNSWLPDAIKRGDTIYKVLFPTELENEIYHIIDYFDYVIDNEDELPNNLYFRDLSRISYQDAFNKAELWTHWLSKRKIKGSEDPDEGEFEVLKLSDGFSIYQLVSPAALNREGSRERMYHCVGGYAKEVAKNNSKIYSLRDRNNHPHCTVELVGKEVEQIKGYHDQNVKPEYQQYVIDFLNYGLEKNWFNRIDELEYIDAILYKGIVYREEDAPDEHKAGINLFHACQRDQEERVKEAITQGADVNFIHSLLTPLIVASSYGSKNIVELLLKHGADPNLDIDGKTALIMAVDNEHLDVVEVLLKYNANPDIQEVPSDGWTALLYAISRENIPIVQTLIDYGADPNVYSRGWTPLVFASLKGDVEVVEILLEAGADPNIKAPMSDTALNAAKRTSENDEIVTLLKKYGAKE